MGYKLEKYPENKSRLTLGFLDENAYTEYHGYMTAGIFEAARKYNLNIIRFGHYNTHNTNRDDPLIGMILSHILQYDLDGLIFLGWARVASFENHESFKRRFSHIPLFSLGTGFPDIPHTYFPGDMCIKDIINHLINVHGFRRIAFVAPFWPDSRSEVYVTTMKEHGIYDPNLYISEAEVANLEVSERGRKAVSILIDERRVKFDAVISLYNDETKGLIKELHARGLRVPDDIAVTSYEDGEIGRFSSPSLTTVYFPYREIGFRSCEKMAELLRGGSIDISNIVPGRVIWRESCGCMPDSVTNSAAGPVEASGKLFEELEEYELAELIKKTSAEIKSEDLDIKALFIALQNNFNNRAGSGFLNELETQLVKLEYSQSFSGVEDIISMMRRVLLPYFVPYIRIERKIYLWAEDLFQQAQILLLDRKSSAWAREEVQSKSDNLVLQEISQKLVDNFSMDNLMDSLEAKLPDLKIPSCYIFIFRNPEDNENPFDHSILAFEYHNHKRIKSRITTCKARQKLSEILFPEDRPYLMMANLLYVGSEVIGFALFEPGPADERIYQTLAIHISTALYGAILLEKLDSSYKRLIDQAHRKGMADIASGILHNVGNILNSINVSIHIIRDLVSISPVKDFLSAEKLLEENIGNIEDFITKHEKGKKLMKYFTKLDQPVRSFQEQLRSNISRLVYNINTIEEIVTAQDSYAGIKSTLEELDIIDIIEDALKMNSASLEKRNIRITRNYGGSLSKTLVQKTKLFHVLINIINNAKEAMLEVPEDARTLSITVSDAGAHKYIRISDTGHGIPAHLLESIFAYGYTTKKGGHGFGLHSCANYMTEMGGKIWAESEGPGKGASFVLLLQN